MSKSTSAECPHCGAELTPMMGFGCTGKIIQQGYFHCLCAGRKPAPWPDSKGNTIHSGDWIRHPSGERGQVVFLSSETRPGNQWRVLYDNESLGRLNLQIGDQGQAVLDNDQ